MHGGRKDNAEKRRRPKTVGRRIRDLREFLGYRGRQADFAKLLGVGQGTLSAWERDDPIRKPSALIYLKLASMARDEAETSLFLDQALIDEHLITSLAERLLKATVKPASKGDVVRVGPLPGTEDYGEMFLSGKGLPNLGFVSYVKAAENLVWLGLPPGTLILDTHERGNRVAPFWYDIVLVKDGRTSADSPTYVVGKVVKVDHSQGGPSVPAGQVIAVLTGSSFREPFAGFHIGSYLHPEWGSKDFHKRLRDDKKFFARVTAEASSGADQGMETWPGIEIVGRVILWSAYERWGAEVDA